MKFEISHSDLIRDELQRFSHYNDSYIDKEGADEEYNNNRPPGFCYEANRIGLPGPLRFVNMSLRAFAGFYCASVYIFGRSSAAYGKNLSSRFSQVLDRMSEREGKKLSWAPIDDKGSGYVVSGNIALLSVGKFSGDDAKKVDYGRVISLGDYGAEPLRIEERDEDYYAHISLLESVASLYVNTVYDRPVKNNFPLPNELVLSLNLLA